MTKANTNSLRIIGGKWRGRRLTFPDVPGLRPTHDRVRETLFNWLMHDIVGAHCLDLFAGSGALGFEALSRGASQVTFVDISLDVCHALRANSKLLDASAQTQILNQDVESLEGMTFTSLFDIIFLDPPFGKGLLEPTLDWLAQSSLLAPAARVYVEVEKDGLDLQLSDNWHQSRHKSTSTLDYYLFDYKSV